MEHESELTVPYIPNSSKEALAQHQTWTEVQHKEMNDDGDNSDNGEEKTSPPPHAAAASAGPHKETATMEDIEEHKDRFLAHFFAMADQFKLEFQKLDDVESELVSQTNQYVASLKTKHEEFRSLQTL
ncbi:hypothetical protein BASA81_000747 [Batrachochytrium salamandrivorans]|nr:hypothetical protein BASA81_000747 [Batrachochytrium salamandrivorans]